jgi:Mg/Co/Ni transporter MgtE
MMNTEYLAVPESATIADAMEALRGNEDLLENLNTVFLLGPGGKLAGVVPLARLFLGPPSRALRELAGDNLIFTGVDEKQNRVTEIFDKYNLLALPVVDEDGALAGVITADDVITVLRH